METRNRKPDRRLGAGTSTGNASGTKPKKHRIRGLLSRVFHVYRKRWFQVLGTGLVFIALMELSYLAYPNPNLVPAMILYGAFLVPITLMVHLYERLSARELPLIVILVTFLSAGAIGVALASTLELALLKPLGHFQFFGVGLIEESSKLIIPVVIFALGTYRSEGAGVMAGLTSAMGFSSLETAGYGFNSFLGNQRGDASGTIASLFTKPLNVLELDVTVVARSLMDPIGHGTWTMLTCFVLFHERRKAGRFVLNWRVVGAFVLAILLHAAWDTSLSVPSSPVWGKVLGVCAFVVTFAFTVWLMKRIINKTRQAMNAEASEENSATPNPAVTAS